jgi:hypothetical protein
MNSDMGDDYIIAPTVAGGSQYQIQVVDASDTLLGGGRIYSFSLPASCGSACGQPYTAATYTTSTPTSPPPSASASASVSASASASASASPTASTGTCTVSTSVVSSWTGGYQVQFTVTDSGTAAITAWKVGFSFSGSQTVANSWNATVTQTGIAVTATNAAYNGTLAPGTSTTWGMVVNGTNQPLPTPTCG